MHISFGFKPVIYNSNRGSVLITVALWLMGLMAVAALAVDIGLMYSHKQELQNIADAGALAGAGALRRGMDPVAAKAVVIGVVNANKDVGESVVVTDNDIVIGAWNDTTKTVDPWDPANNPTLNNPAVQVTVKRTTGSASGPETTILAGIFGRKTVDVSARAIAGIWPTGSGNQRKPVEMMIVQDASSSFQNQWDDAVAANAALINLGNQYSVQNDSTGYVAFNAALSQSYLRNTALYTDYTVNYPQMNQGIKYSTTSDGRPNKVDQWGASSASGIVRPMASSPVRYDTSHVLPSQLQQLYGTNSGNTNGLIYRGNAWGDTDTSAGIKYAIDQWYDSSDNLRTGVSASTRKSIVVVSDGMPHSVDGNTATNTLKANAIAQANRAGRLGITVHTVTLEGSNGANYAFNESLIRNGGYAFRAPDASSLIDQTQAVGGIEYGLPHLLK
jgi:Flp pilus assembly protein TadG